MVATRNLVYNFCMKKLLAILVLGIGIVLSIPKSVQAVGSCDFNAAESTPTQFAIGAGYTAKGSIHYCDDNDVMEINANMSRNWALLALNTNAADNVSITISADGSLTSTKSGASTITGNGTDGATIVNAGTVTAGINAINFNTGTNVTITNQSGGVIKAEHATLNSRNTAIKTGAAGFTLNNSGDITATGARTIIAGGTNAIITNNSGGTIQAGTNYGIEASGTGLTLNNSGDIIAIANNGISTEEINATINNNSGGTIQAATYGLKGTATNSETSITNSGNIYGTTNRAIHITGSEYTITNESGGLIRAGSDGSTNTSHILAVEATSGGTNLTLDNYGTITAGANTIKTVSTGMTLTNHSGGTISGTADGSTLKTIFIDGNNNTIENYGTISGAGDTNSINVDSGITGTNIIIHGSSTITGEIDLESTATAITFACDFTSDMDVEVENKTNMTVTNNLCGNDTYEILDSSKNADGDNSETDGYIRIDEGLEVVSNNASYRSENVLTKLKGIFSAANYIDGVEPEDKFFRLFYSNVKRENMYKGSMAGVVGQLSPINWGNVTSNVFLGYSKHYGDFDNGEFLGGGNFALGLKNVFTKNGMKVSFSPMIGLNDLDVTDYDSDSTAKVKTNLLSEFLAVNGKIDKEIKTSEAGSLNLSVQSTLGLQRFPDYLSSFSDGDLSVDEAIEQVLSGGFEVKYNEELGKGFIIRPYVGVSLNHNLNNNIDIVKDDDSKPASPADSVTSGYYAGLTLNKKAKDISFDLDLMYGNEDGLINQIAAVSFTKTFGKVKTAKLEKKSDTLKVDTSSTTQDYDKGLTELGELRKANEALKAQNEALKVQNEKLKLLAKKTLEENQASKKLIVELLKENEKIKLEKQMMTNQILESENKDLLEQLEGSNEGNKPPVKFLIIFAIIFMLATIGLTSIVASIYNRIMYRPARA